MVTPKRIKALSELPQDMAPARDLWPQIQSRLGSRRRSWKVPMSLAASLLLVVFGFVIGNRYRPPNAALTLQQSGAHILATFTTDPHYQRQRQELLNALPAKLESLPPESQQRVQRQPAGRANGDEEHRGGAGSRFRQCPAAGAADQYLPGRNTCIYRRRRRRWLQSGDLIMTKWMLLVAAVFSTTGVAAAEAQFSKQVPVAAQDRVSVSNISGSVTITTWDRPEVDVQGELGSGIERVDVRQESGNVDIHVVVKLDQGGWRNYDGWKNSEARLQIRLPANVQVEVSTISAQITVTGIHGKMRLKSISGNIFSDFVGTDLDARTISGIIGLSGGDAHSRLRAASVSGDVNLIHIAGDVEVRTTSGGIDIEMQGADEVRAQSVSGSVAVRGPLASDGHLDLQSVSGRVKVAVQAAEGYRYNVSSFFSGTIRNCFGYEVQRSESRSSERLEGVRGEGKGSVSVKGHSGSVELCDK